MPNLKVLFIALTSYAILYLIPHYANAQYFVGPVASGAGQAAIASAEPAEGAMVNPAILAHAPEFSMGLFYQDGYLAQNEHVSQLGVVLVDNSQSVFVPGALAYFKSRRTSPFGSAVNEDYYQFSMGGFLFKHFSVGLTGLGLQHKVENGEKYWQYDAVAGIHYNPHPDWAFAFTYQHFIQPNPDLPEWLRLNPTAHLGVNYIMNEYVRVRSEVVRQEFNNPDGELDIRFGLESFVQEFWIVRLGGRWDNVSKRRFLTAGMTLNGPRFKLDYAFIKSNEVREEALHSVDIRVPF